MKILCCIESYLPGVRGGGPVRSLANMVDQLSASHQFSILTRNRDYLSDERYDSVVHETWTNCGSASIYYANDDSLEQSFIEAYQHIRPDWVYLHGAFPPMTRLILALRKKYEEFSGAPFLIAPHGNLSTAALRHHRLRKQLWLIYSKAMGHYRDVFWHAASSRESEQVRHCFGLNAKIREVPMAPRRSEALIASCGEKKRTNATSGKFAQSPGLSLVYFGRLSPEKNLEFAFQLLAEFSRAQPDCSIVYDLIGSGEPVYEASLRERARTLPENVHIRFHGELSHSELSHQLSQGASFGSYHALLMPSFTENFSYTVLESFEAGIPVLISDQTPWRSLEEKGVGWDLSLSRSEEWLFVLDGLIRLGPEERDKQKTVIAAYVSEWVNGYEAKVGTLFT